MTLFRNAAFATVSGFVVSTLAYAQTPQPGLLTARRCPKYALHGGR